MKRMMAFALAAVLVLTMTACGTSSAVRAADLTAQYEAGEIKVTTAPGLDPEMAAADFAMRLLQTQTGGGNVLLSPLSVLLALGMTANGAAGDTLTQMESTLGFTRDDLNAYLYAVTALLTGEGSGVSLADSVWLRDEENRLSVEPDFLQAVRSYYGAGIFSAPFDAATCRDINNWVSRQTNGMIDRILDKIPPEAVVYLVNAMAFDGKWALPFERNSVRDGDFTTEDGRRQTAAFMYGEADAYLQGSGGVGFVKYYENGCAFAALLPDEGVSVDALVASLTGEGLRNLLTGAQDRPVQCVMPKFAADYDAELSEALMGMGMTDLFDPLRADLSAMGSSTQGPLSVSRVLHKTHIDVDEAGTKAAAATVVEVKDECAVMQPEEPVVITLDRPFVYLLLSADTMTPLFIGTMMDMA